MRVAVLPGVIPANVGCVAHVKWVGRHVTIFVRRDVVTSVSLVAPNVAVVAHVVDALLGVAFGFRGNPGGGVDCCSGGSRGVVAVAGHEGDGVFGVGGAGVGLGGCDAR